MDRASVADDGTRAAAERCRCRHGRIVDEYT